VPEPLRVLMFPAQGNASENRYLDVLVDGLRALDVEVRPWKKAVPSGPADVFHVHWPEVLGHIHARRGQGLRGWWAAQLLWWTIRRVKRGGGKLVWTAHDITPHEQRLRDDPFTSRLLARFLNEVDAVISLTEAGIAPVKAALPMLRDKPFHLGRHPHYRTVYPPQPFDTAGLARYGAAEGQFVYAFLGRMRANKSPEILAEAFRGLEQDGNFLILAGGATDDMREQLEAILADNPNSLRRYDRIPEDEMARLHACSDVLVFPGTDYFNSGTIYTALSLNVPVIAVRSPVNSEIQALVGEEWLFLYDGPLSTDILRRARTVVARRREGATCDLSAFAPDLAARQHLAAYRDGLANARRTPA